MTAAIVTHRSRTPIGDRAAASWAYSGGAERRHETGTAPGQLWERVAETPSNAPAPLTARQDAGIVRAYAEKAPSRGPRVGGGYKSIRSQQSSNTYRMAASGIIRAGERIK
jgi:hypothetical protein